MKIESAETETAQNQTLLAEIKSLRSPSNTQTFRNRKKSNYTSVKTEGITSRERVKIKNEVSTKIDIHENINTVLSGKRKRKRRLI